MEQAPLEADPVAEAPVRVPVGAVSSALPSAPTRSSETLPPVPTRGLVASELVVDEVRKGLATAMDARSLGRVLRDAMSVITDASAFSIALFHLTRPEVVYRYKVVGPDRDSAELGRQHVDDGPACYAARHDRRWHVFAREVAIRSDVDARVREVIVLQLPLSAGGEVFGVVTVQTFRPEGFTDQELRLVATVVEASSSHFAQARSSGRLQPAGPAAAGDVAPTVLTPPVAVQPPAAPAVPSASDVLKEHQENSKGKKKNKKSRPVSKYRGVFGAPAW